MYPVKFYLFTTIEKFVIALPVTDLIKMFIFISQCSPLIYIRHTDFNVIHVYNYSYLLVTFASVIN